MRTITLTFILLFTFFGAGKLKAQGNNEQIDAFISKVETYIQESFEETSDLIHTKQILKARRSTTKAKNKILGQEFIKKTIYTREGFKKEIFKIWSYSNHRRIKMVEIISINDEYFKIKFFTYHMNGKVLTKKSLEEFAAGSSYKKVNYDRKGKVIDKIEVLSWE